MLPWREHFFEGSIDGAHFSGTQKVAPNSVGMQHAVYKCPATDIAMLTGLHYEDVLFEEIARGPVRLHCPLCGTMHIVPLWRGADLHDSRLLSRLSLLNNLTVLISVASVASLRAATLLTLWNPRGSRK